MFTENYVTEKIQKKKESKENGINQSIIFKKMLKKKLKLIRNIKISYAEKFINENIIKKKSFLTEKKTLKKMNKFLIPSKAKIFFVIRIRGINGVSPRVKKILELLRLNQINNGVFVKINSSTIQMLRKIEPFVAYGYPSLESIKNLLEKRGYGKIGKRGSWQKVNLVGDGVIHQGLSNVGIFTLEEVINEVYTCGPRFREVNNFLWPFKLKSPKKGYSNIGKIKHFYEGGAYGNWEEAINKLINRMN
jgi:large subunit ribosomal protein L7e